MKEIIDQLKSFIADQHWLHWTILMLFCSISVFINYHYGLQLKVDQMGRWPEYFSHVLLYAIHTVFAYLLYSFFKKDYSFWAKPGFICLLLLSFLIFGFRAVMYQHYALIGKISPPDTAYINGMVFNDVFRWLYLVIPVTIVWVIFDRKQTLYGVSLKHHKAKVYWILLLCMVPLIVGASFLSDFLDYYPRYHKLEAFEPPVWKIWVFEIFYGIDFSSIELFFRGFMVMAFIKYVGPGAILPMASFYLSIHYGKPMGEAISSFFGGTILGVISYHSRSIFGGVMVHAGIAWLMEIGGTIGNYVKDYYKQ